MRTTLVYDLPTRIFHGLFAGLFLFSFVVANTADDESLVFIYHMLSGLLLGGLVLWRILWGIIGSKHAKFSSLSLNPIDLKDYFIGAISGSQRKWSGHNPASSWAAITMFGLALGLAITGFLMSSGYKEALEEIHEFFANAFIVVVLAHLAGVFLHSLRHRDGIGLSMLDGRKEISDSAGSIPSQRGIAAVILLALFVLGATYLFKNFEAQNRTLTILGQTLQLGKNEENHGAGTMETESRHHEEEEED